MNHERLFIVRMTIEFLPGAKNYKRESCATVNSNVSDTIRSVYNYENSSFFSFKQDR